jgi:4-hydroxy-3-methylbut-2-enyl diphosphate reductase
VPADLEGIVGVTAGASAPEELIAAVLDRLAPAEGVEEVRVTDEDEYFPPPRELRSLLSDKGQGDALLDDRAVSASDVLAALRP